MWRNKRNQENNVNSDAVQSKRGKWKKWERGRGNFSGQARGGTPDSGSYSGKANFSGRGRGGFAYKRRDTSYSPNTSANFTRANTSNVLNIESRYIELENNDNVAEDSFKLHWRNYISLAKYESDDFSKNKLNIAKEYLNSRQNEVETTDELFTFKKFSISFSDLITNVMLKERWPNLERELDDNADLVMGIFGLARYELWTNEVKVRGNLPIIRY